MRFSDLTVDFPGATNRLYERLEQLRRSGVEITDLVGANVNDHGIVFPQDHLSAILTEAAGEARIYKPDSLGQKVAREAIASYAQASPEHILLTPGTSVSYWYAFKLLSEPGNEVLCPMPSYPLFDYIARLAGVVIRHYRLDEGRDWSIDMDDLEAGITERTRAIVVISPHNPTGMVVDGKQIAQLADIATRHEVAIIFDEVFREFIYNGEQALRLSGSDAPLIFTLNGFSKMFALPGMKVGWMAVSGDDRHVDRSMKALELISDTFLPVNETAQFAVPAVFEAGQRFLAEYRGRLSDRRDAAIAALGSRLVTPPSGGFHLVAPFTRDVEDEDLALELLENEGILVHPGYFYDTEGRHIAMSFVQDEKTLGEALGRVTNYLV